MNLPETYHIFLTKLIFVAVFSFPSRKMISEIVQNSDSFTFRQNYFFFFAHNAIVWWSPLPKKRNNTQSQKAITLICRTRPECFLGGSCQQLSKKKIDTSTKYEYYKNWESKNLIMQIKHLQKMKNIQATKKCKNIALFLRSFVVWNCVEKDM